MRECKIHVIVGNIYKSFGHLIIYESKNPLNSSE